MTKEELVERMARELLDILAEENKIGVPYETLPEWAIDNLYRYTKKLFPIIAEFIDSFENPYRNCKSYQVEKKSMRYAVEKFRATIKAELEK